MLITESKKRVLAYHEAGHAIMGLSVRDYDNVRKVSIVPRGRTGGATYFEPSEERLDISLVTREYLECKIMVALGGRIAEELEFGTMFVTTGASGDLQEVYRIANDMVTRFGFNETLGKVSWANASGTDNDVNSEIRFLVERLYGKARFIMQTNEVWLQRMAAVLM